MLPAMTLVDTRPSRRAPPNSKTAAICAQDHHQQPGRRCCELGAPMGCGGTAAARPRPKEPCCWTGQHRLLQAEHARPAGACTQTHRASGTPAPLLTSTACLSVSVRAPTDVPNALATSLEPACRHDERIEVRALFGTFTACRHHLPAPGWTTVRPRLAHEHYSL